MEECYIHKEISKFGYFKKLKINPIEVGMGEKIGWGVEIVQKKNWENLMKKAVLRIAYSNKKRQKVRWSRIWDGHRFYTDNFNEAKWYERFNITG